MSMRSVKTKVAIYVRRLYATQVFGLPWWMAILIVLVGILIGRYVIPYHFERPTLVE